MEENFNLQVKLLDNDDVFSNSQKCLLPFELFPRSVCPGSIGRCFIKSENSPDEPTENYFLCTVFSMGNLQPKSFCLLNDSVWLGNEFKSLPFQSDSILTRIEFLDNRNRIVFKQIDIEIYLQDFKLSEDQIQDRFLEKIAGEFLSLYQFKSGSWIDCKRIGESYGIAKIFVALTSTNKDGIGSVDRDTTVNIIDIKYIGKSQIKSKKLGGVETYKSALERLKNEIEVRTKLCNWQMAPSTSCLIVGPSGSGKTTICHNFVLENTANFFEIRSIDIIRPHLGETEEFLREFFRNIEIFVTKLQPKCLTVLLIEDIDLICPYDFTKNDAAHSPRISSQLMLLLDELYQKRLKVLILATTSHIEAVSLSVRRPGRFENEIFINIPDEKQRESILDAIVRDIQIFERHDHELNEILKFVAKLTAGYVIGDLQLLIQNALRIFYKNHKLEDVASLRSSFESALKTMKPISLKGSDVTVYTPIQTFDSIGGMENLKKTLQISILAPLKNPALFERFGINPIKGILLYGPPGCAKTTIAKCIAKEANMTLISTSGAEIYSPYVGNAEKFICKIFNTARKNLPCLIFMDEIDALVGSREKSGTKNDVQTRVLSALLTEMDGIGVKLQSSTASATEMKNQILVVAATNRPDMIDNALMRPGRFDKLIHVTAPDFESRVKIFNIFKEKMPFSENVDFEELARKTRNFSGADLCNLCNEAAMQAFTTDPSVDRIPLDAFNQVMTNLRPSLSENQIQWYRNFERSHCC